MNYRILPEFLYLTAERFPDHGMGYVGSDRSIEFETYQDLLTHARILLAGLHDKGIRPGDRILLALDSSSEIIPLLWACFIGGIVPALLQPPVSFTSYNAAAEKADKVYRLLNPPAVVVSRQHFDNWKAGQIPSEKLIDYTSLGSDNLSDDIDNRDVGPEDLALIQFSSGSTGDPKGVMLTHQNIISNILDIIKGIRLGSEDVSVNWMPLYHDMGLFGFHITPLCTGTTQYFVDSADFVKDPFLWLDIISDKKVTITGCPNFGQMLVNRYLSRRPAKDWDFSQVRIIFNGAEPISVPVMHEFLTRLEVHKLKTSAMFPAYGMAESTLAITFPPLDSGAEVKFFGRDMLLKEGKAEQSSDDDPSAISLVNLGNTLEHCDLRILDNKGRIAGESMVGHVQVKGPAVTSGYFNDPVVTQESFSGEWLRTGDLGFMLDGNLYITGRAKDIIFINGVNYYSHDLENLALGIPGITFGKLVIGGYFDQEEGRDRIIVFLVSPQNDQTTKLFATIRDHFSSLTGLLLETFVSVKSSDIPRTTSGKIQRYKMVNRFLKGEIGAVVKL